MWRIALTLTGQQLLKRLLPFQRLVHIYPAVTEKKTSLGKVVEKAEVHFNVTDMLTEGI